MSAQYQVFNTTELLELIILQLPPRRILISQAVCCRFRDVVAKSLRIRQTLFLEPDHSATQRTNELIPIKNFTVHCGPAKTPQDLYNAKEDGSARPEENFTGGGLYIYQMNKDIDGSWRKDKIGSWRHMLPCQPPPAMIEFGLPHMWERQVIMVPKDGEFITFGKMEDITRPFWPDSFRMRGGWKRAHFWAYGPQRKKWLFARDVGSLYVVGNNEQPFEDLMNMMRKGKECFLS